LKHNQLIKSYEVSNTGNSTTGNEQIAWYSVIEVWVFWKKNLVPNQAT